MAESLLDESPPSSFDFNRKTLRLPLGSILFSPERIARPKHHRVSLLEPYWQTLGQTMAAELADIPAAEVARAFPDIATSALAGVPAPTIDVLTLTDWVSSQSPLPRQVNFHSGFGDPPLVVFECPHFYLEVLFWFPSRSDIHGHGFSGAFKVLAGQSIQIEYTFEQTDAPEEGVRLGLLTPQHIELLSPGQICPITEGDAFLHAVAHVGTPSLTLVARTHRASHTRQFSFQRCGFGHLSSLHHQAITRQVQVLLSLRRAKPDTFSAKLIELLKRTDQHQFFAIAGMLIGRMGEPEFALRFLPLLEAQFRSSRPRALEALREELKRGLDWDFIRREANPHQQLRLVLAELCPDPQVLHDLVCRSHQTTQPQEIIDAWCEQAAPAAS